MLVNPLQCYQAAFPGGLDSSFAPAQLFADHLANEVRYASPLRSCPLSERALLLRFEQNLRAVQASVRPPTSHSAVYISTSIEVCGERAGVTTHHRVRAAPSDWQLCCPSRSNRLPGGIRGSVDGDNC